MPHNLTASPPPQCLTVSPTHRLTASPPHCRVAPWCDRATNPTVLTVPTPPHCHPARSADATLPTLPQCRVAPWCDRATNPTATRQMSPHRPPRCHPISHICPISLIGLISLIRPIPSHLVRDFAGFAGFCVGEGRLAWGLVGCRVARSHQGATLHSGLGWG